MIHYTDGLILNKAFENSRLIEQWKERISQDILLSDYTILSYDMFGSHVGFIEMLVQYMYNDVHFEERIILSGLAASMIILIPCENNIYTILVEQPRIASGQITLEYPAGMADDSEDIASVAVRELEEEVGFICQKEDLIQLNSSPVYSHPEAFDESGIAFAVVKKMSRSELDSYDNKHHGADADEQILTRVVKFDDVLNHTQDAITIANTFLCKKAIECGKVNLN